MGTPTGLLFKQIHDKLEKQANNTLRQQGLTMMQVSVLLTIQGAEGKRCSMKELERFSAWPSPRWRGSSLGWSRRAW